MQNCKFQECCKKHKACKETQSSLTFLFVESKDSTSSLTQSFLLLILSNENSLQFHCHRCNKQSNANCPHTPYRCPQCLGMSWWKSQDMEHCNMNPAPSLADLGKSFGDTYNLLHGESLYGILVPKIPQILIEISTLLQSSLAKHLSNIFHLLPDNMPRRFCSPCSYQISQ